ncbi:MAG: serine/threonine-protein kinase [Actinomycetota bacterium]|nr:serine/threonine-protein kinase [Actinomycetota bacterium]
MAQDARIGTTLAGYRIDSLIGRGGMGTVYLAEHLGLGRKVALKVLSPDLADDPRFRDRFVRESRLAASIEDPNIVPIYEAGESNGVLFIAMRYVSGTDLKALIATHGALPVERTASIVSQVASALDAAHEQGLVHRDVKPANVLIVAGGESRPDKVYLSDFGLTKRASSDSGLTATGQFVGTLDYAAPEQFEGGALTPQTDVYSLGCVVYECLTGEVPFPRDREAAVLHAHLMEAPPRITEKRPELPEGIDAVVATAMAKRPGDRYATAGDLAAAVGAALRRRAAASPETRRGLDRRVLVAAAAAVLVAVAVIVALLLRGGGAPARGTAGGGPTPATTLPSTPPTLTSSPISADPNSVLRLDPDNGAPVADIPVGADPHGVAFSGRYLWVVNRSDHTISRIDPDTNQVVSTGGGMTGPCNIAPDPGGGVWVTNCLASPYEVDRISPESGQVDERVKVPDVPAGVAFGAGDVWAALLPPSHSPGTVVRIDPATGKIVHTFQVGAGAEYVDFGESALWVGNAEDGTVSKIDAVSGQVATIPVGTDPFQVEVGNGFVWVNIRSDHAIYKIDPLRDRVVDIIDGVRGIMTTEGGNLWVADPEAPTLWRIDTDTDQVTAQFDLPYSGFLATADGSIWLSAPITFDDQCCP